MKHAPYTEADFDVSPLMFYYEVTQACDLVCEHCRASAQKTPHPDELATDQSRRLIDQVATFPKPPTHRADRRRSAETRRTSST